MLTAGLLVAAIACSPERPRPKPEPERAPAQPEAERAAAPDVDAPEVDDPAARERARIDVHVHLVDNAVDELLAALDRAQIEAAVVLASPHLDPALRPPDPSDPFSGWREANDRLLLLSADHRVRLLPFITVDPADVEVAELERWLGAGACGVKLYIGHHALHARPLADPAHAELFAALEREAVPVLLHVNTFRFEAELDALLAAYPKLKLVCPHLCGARTDIDRLERLLAKHPALLVDTSHGPGEPGVAGFANLDAERERVRALIEAQPERFLFGSDLVTTRYGAEGAWDRQLDANLGLLERAEFEFTGTDYRGLALGDAALAAVLHDNAARWLAGCRAAP